MHTHTYIAESILDANNYSVQIVKSVLKSSVHDMIETNKQKNHIGSAMGMYQESLLLDTKPLIYMHTYIHTPPYSWLYRRVQCACCKHRDGRLPRNWTGSHSS